MKMSMTQASTERNAAIAHVRRLKQEMDQMQRDRDNVRSWPLNAPRAPSELDLDLSGEGAAEDGAGGHKASPS